MPEQEKRWVVVRPPGARYGGIPPDRASNEEQAAHVGNQTGGRVILFLYADDFGRDYAATTGPSIGAIARNGQSCRLQRSLWLAAVTGPVLALGMIAQVVPMPFRRGLREVRLVLWTLGGLVWLFCGRVWFLHTFR